MLPNTDKPIAGQTLVNCEWADGSRTLHESELFAEGKIELTAGQMTPTLALPHDQDHSRIFARK
jgi:hypothetical protein